MPTLQQIILRKAQCLLLSNKKDIIQLNIYVLQHIISKKCHLMALFNPYKFTNLIIVEILSNSAFVSKSAALMLHNLHVFLIKYSVCKTSNEQKIH